MGYLKKFLERLKSAASAGDAPRGAAFPPVVTPQSEPVLGVDQVPNSAGGYVWAVDDWTCLRRFLILGTERGSYYASEATLTAENAAATIRCIDSDGKRVVDEIVAISESGRAARNDPALFALALAASRGDALVRRHALAALPKVARIGTHLFHFAAYVDSQRGWGRGLREAMAAWYNDRPAGEAVYQAIKYRQRDGWSHRDLLRLAHPKAPGEAHAALYHWICHGWPGVGADPHPDEALRPIWALENLKATTDPVRAAALIRDHRLPREAVPTPLLNAVPVWEALLEEMPMTALIRNLSKLTSLGIVAPLSKTTQQVCDQIVDSERIRKARLHPVAILSALRTYAQGHGERGHLRWSPVPKVIDALDRAFYDAFRGVEPTNKRWLLALDVSGSMACSQIAGVPGLTPRDASGAMALVTAAREPNHHVMAFGQSFVPLDISPRQRLDAVIKSISGLPFGATDCALPMVWAERNRVPVDVFVVYTDSETWCGEIHPFQALRSYREKMGIPARLAVVGMVANRFSIADPSDRGMLDVVGFDTATPGLMRDFALGEV